MLRGSIHPVTLCWEVLQPTARAAAFSLKFIHDGVIVADRTSIHGLGRYPSAAWQLGAIFCDEVDVLLDDPDVVDDPMPQPGQVYDMLLVMLDARTGAVDWSATTADGAPLEFPIIGQVASPIGDATLDSPRTPTAIEFANFARLEGYSIEGVLRPGETIQLSLNWTVTGQTAENWTQFIHLIGSEVAVTLVDGIPRGGNYPTWAWSPGEQLADAWTFQLPDDLPSGDYTLRLGFYRQDTGERLPATQDNQPLPDGSAAIIQFHID